jgi:hypothetical protein
VRLHRYSDRWKERKTGGQEVRLLRPLKREAVNERFNVDRLGQDQIDASCGEGRDLVWQSIASDPNNQPAIP